MIVQYWVLTDPHHKLHTPTDVTKALRNMYNDGVIENYEYFNQWKNDDYGTEELIEVEHDQEIDFFDMLEFYMFMD